MNDSSLLMSQYDVGNKGYLNYTDFHRLYFAYIPKNYRMDGTLPSNLTSPVSCMNTNLTFTLFDPTNSGRLNESQVTSAAIYLMLMQSGEYTVGLHILAVFVILAVSTLGAGLPILMKRFPQCFPFPFVFVIGKHVGTGVLISLGFVHLLAPSYTELDGNPCVPTIFQFYPFNTLFALSAALVMHLIETLASIATKPKRIHKKKQPKLEDGKDPIIDNPDGAKAPEAPSDVDESTRLIVEVQRRHSRTKNHVQKPNGSHGDHEHHIVTAGNTASHSEHDEKSSSDSEGHGHSHGNLIGSADKTISAFILEFGLTAHSIIIGITVGVAVNADIPTLLVALSFHQFFEGMALGARLADVGFSGVSEIILMLIYALAAPLGIAIGIPIYGSYNGNDRTTNLSTGTFDAVSAGIILYVAFVQMLGVEFVHDMKKKARSGPRKFALFAGIWIGAGIMAIIGLWM